MPTPTQVETSQIERARMKQLEEDRWLRMENKFLRPWPSSPGRQ